MWGCLEYQRALGFYRNLILSSQASARLLIIGNTTNALTTQKAFLNNFENVVNRRVGIEEDIKHYQDTLSYASSKVDYMLLSDVNLKIKARTAGYNNKILVSDRTLSLGKNSEVNASVPKNPVDKTAFLKHTCIPKSL